MSASAEYDNSSVSLFGVRIALDPHEEMIRRIVLASRPGMPVRVGYSHFEILLHARRSASLRETLNALDYNYYDGVGLLLALRILAKVRPPRRNASDFNFGAVNALAAAGKRVFFLGGRQEMSDDLCGRYDRLAGGKELAASHHGYFDDGDETVLSVIEAFAPDALIIGMGSVRQYEWLARNSKRLKTPAIILVGGFLEFFAGTKPRAPQWMRSLALEWLHRLRVEPVRLAARYLIGIPKFLGIVLVERMRQKKKAGC